jgi:hypothetical protein
MLTVQQKVNMLFKDQLVELEALTYLRWVVRIAQI